jgi:hypothetical protein
MVCDPLSLPLTVATREAEPDLRRVAIHARQCWSDDSPRRACRQPRCLVSPRPEALRPRLATGLPLQRRSRVQPQPASALPQYNALTCGGQMSRPGDVRTRLQVSAGTARAPANVPSSLGPPAGARTQRRPSVQPAGGDHSHHLRRAEFPSRRSDDHRRSFASRLRAWRFRRFCHLT